MQVRGNEHLSQADINSYNRDGYLLLRDAFSRAEVELMLRTIDEGVKEGQGTYIQEDVEGNKTKLAIWHKLESDIWGAVSTSPTLVNTARVLLDREVAFFHGKIMLKEAEIGGAWEWHQDYGYWYDQGFLYPQMLSAFVALDPATRENGCLSVLRGSHKLGRLNHVKIRTQFGIEKDRIDLAKPYFDLVYCEMEPGSVLFFDCNLIHSSEPNRSAQHRRSFITAYTVLGNPQIKGQLCADEICPVGTSDAISSLFKVDSQK